MAAIVKNISSDIVSLILAITLAVIFNVLPLKGEMCSTMISAADGENFPLLQKRVFSSFRSTCRKGHSGEYFTEPSDPHIFRYIMGPLSMPFKLDFKVKSYAGVMIALTERTANDSIFAEITIGGWSNSKSVIRACHSDVCKDRFGEHDERILDENEYRPFCIEYVEGVVTVGKGGQQEAFSEWDAGAYHGHVTSQVYVGISGAKYHPDYWVFDTKYTCE